MYDGILRSELAVPRLRLWAPRPDDVRGALSEQIASCLAAAFSSGPWARTPMPLGDARDHHSARGILAELAGRAQAVVASVDGAGFDTGTRGAVGGCVVGSVLDPDVIDAYGLAPYGARPGDGLLAYIGVDPRYQGCRGLSGPGRRLALYDPRTSPTSAAGGRSLAGLLFGAWLEQGTIRRCPRVFVRTRRILKPIIHLATRNRFAYRGSFHLDFHGTRQERIVYSRENR